MKPLRFQFCKNNSGKKEKQDPVTWANLCIFTACNTITFLSVEAKGALISPIKSRSFGHNKTG